jgi:hypothetical protein
LISQSEALANKPKKQRQKQDTTRITRIKAGIQADLKRSLSLAGLSIG